MPKKKEIDDAVEEIRAARIARDRAEMFRRSWSIELSYIDDDLVKHKYDMVILRTHTESGTTPTQELLKVMVEQAYLAIITEQGGR